MKNLDSLLKAKGYRKTWFIKHVLNMPVASYYAKAKTNAIPAAAVQRAMDHLHVTFEQLTQ